MAPERHPLTTLTCPRCGARVRIVDSCYIDGEFEWVAASADSKIVESCCTERPPGDRVKMGPGRYVCPHMQYALSKYIFSSTEPNSACTA
jgi:hypothetical protein